jgi:IclR family transcriptional regulator, acetate operon repressor
MASLHRSCSIVTSKTPSSGSPAQVRVLHKTLDILEALRRENTGVNLALVSRWVGMPQPTVYRILNTLKIRGYVDRRTDGTYRVSNKLFSRRHQKSQDEILLELAKPVMVNLSSQCQETVNLATLDGSEMVIIGTVEGQQSLRLISKVGNRRYIHSTALGKAFASRMHESEVRELLQSRGMPRLTAATITSQTVFLAELKRVRRSGIAIDEEENEPGVCCIGSAIEGPSGKPIASLSISGPAFRLLPQRLRCFRADLRESCDSISATIRGRKLTGC